LNNSCPLLDAAFPNPARITHPSQQKLLPSTLHLPGTGNKYHSLVSALLVNFSSNHNPGCIMGPKSPAVYV